MQKFSGRSHSLQMKGSTSLKTRVFVVVVFDGKLVVGDHPPLLLKCTREETEYTCNIMCVLYSYLIGSSGCANRALPVLIAAFLLSMRNRTTRWKGITKCGCISIKYFPVLDFFRNLLFTAHVSAKVWQRMMNCSWEIFLNPSE